MKRILYAFFCCLLLLSFGAACAETGGGQRITTTVPCTVTLVIGEKGKVTVQREVYTGNASICAAFGTVLSYDITPANGYRISRVLYDGVDVTTRVRNGRFTAPELRDNATLTVSFVKHSGPIPNTPKTGDTSCPGLWAALLCLSGTALLILFRKKRRRA